MSVFSSVESPGIPLSDSIARGIQTQYTRLTWVCGLRVCTTSWFREKVPFFVGSTSLCRTEKKPFGNRLYTSLQPTDECRSHNVKWNMWNIIFVKLYTEIETL